MIIGLSNTINIIKKAQLFAGFSPKDYEILFSLIKPLSKCYGKKELLIQDGDLVNYVGVLCRGKISSAKIDYEGNTSLHYVLEPPQIFGLEIAATPSQISSITVTALEDSQVVLFNYRNLTDPEKLPGALAGKVMQNMLTLLANENMRRLYKIELLCHKSLRERILTYLRFVSRKEGQVDTFMIPFNREQLAQYLNVNRTALSHELSCMQRDGLITFRKNSFTLHS